MNTEKKLEGVDYELIPSAEAEIEQAWDVRILQGDFVETVVRFGNIAFNGETGCINFNFVVISSPSGSTEDDLELQEIVGDILESVLEDAVNDGTLVTQDPNSEDESED